MGLALSVRLSAVSVVFYTLNIQNSYILSLIITIIIIIIVVVIIITATFIIIGWRNALLDTNEETFIFMLKMCYDRAICHSLIKVRQIFPK